MNWMRDARFWSNSCGELRAAPPKRGHFIVNVYVWCTSDSPATVGLAFSVLCTAKPRREQPRFGTAPFIAAPSPLAQPSPPHVEALAAFAFDAVARYVLRCSDRAWRCVYLFRTPGPCAHAFGRDGAAFGLAGRRGARHEARKGACGDAPHNKTGGHGGGRGRGRKCGGRGKGRGWDKCCMKKLPNVHNLRIPTKDPNLAFPV